MPESDASSAANTRAAGHLLVAFGGAALIMLLAGLGFAAGYGKEALPILAACLIQIPAIWLVGGLTDRKSVV